MISREIIVDCATEFSIAFVPKPWLLLPLKADIDL